MENKDTVLKKSFYKKWWVWVVAVFVLLFVIGNSSGDTAKTTNEGVTSLQETSVPKVDSKTWQEVKTFSGKGNQNTSSFLITGDKVKISAITTGGRVGTYSAFDLEKEEGGFMGAGLSISTDGSEDGTGETIYRNLKAGSYYIGVITGVSWKVKVEEYR